MAEKRNSDSAQLPAIGPCSPLPVVRKTEPSTSTAGPPAPHTPPFAVAAVERAIEKEALT